MALASLRPELAFLSCGGAEPAPLNGAATGADVSFLWNERKFLSMVEVVFCNLAGVETLVLLTFPALDHGKFLSRIGHEETVVSQPFLYCFSWK